jgi:hypothetical protein
LAGLVPASYASVEAMAQVWLARDWVAISPTCLDVGLGAAVVGGHLMLIVADLGPHRAHLDQP